MLKNIEKWGGPEPSRTWRRVGPWPAIRPSCGPSRWPPTSVARATRSWSAGPLASRPRGNPEPVPACGGHRADRSRGGRSTGTQTVNGVVQTPMEGVSMMYTFADPKAAGRHRTQYFEISATGHLQRRLVAATVHKAPWEAAPRRELAEDVWELYNVDEDFSETNDLAASNPAKLKELQALFMKEAERYRVLPIDDRSSNGSTPPLRVVLT